MPIFSDSDSLRLRFFSGFDELLVLLGVLLPPGLAAAAAGSAVGSTMVSFSEIHASLLVAVLPSS